MHQSIVSSTILVIALVAAVWGYSIIVHGSGKGDARASSAIDVMQMMKNAKGLSEQNYPAY